MFTCKSFIKLTPDQEWVLIRRDEHRNGVHSASRLHWRLFYISLIPKSEAFYCTPIDGKLGLEKFDVARWRQTSAYILRIVNNIAETNFFKKTDTRRLFRETTPIWSEKTCSETTSNRWEEMSRSSPQWGKNEYPAQQPFIFRVFQVSQGKRVAGKERREARKKITPAWTML